MSERSYGTFHRVISLPEGADAENATATFRDGVLKIEMPYAQRRRGRTLQISDGGDDNANERSQWSSNQAGTSKSGSTAQQSSASPSGNVGQQSATGSVQGDESQRGGGKEASR